MAVITVTSTGDAINAPDGTVSLREAITAANDNANFGNAIGVGAYGADTIAFNIPGSGVKTIAPTSPLPVITDPVTIDGYTEPGSVPNSNPFGEGLNTTLRIALVGTGAGASAVGLNLGAGSAGSTIDGLAINQFSGDGILVASNGNTVVGNFVGTDAAGTSALGNGQGIHVLGLNNTIGGTNAADRNLVSGNAAGSGVFIEAGSGDVVQGNLIGTNAAGTAALANEGGITLDNAPNNTIGGTAAGAGNVLSGSTYDGLVIYSTAASASIVQGNLIGTNAAGTSALANLRFGVYVLAPNNTIGGTVAGSANVISGNSLAGIDFGDGAVDNALQGNKIGVALDGVSPLGNADDGVEFGDPFGGGEPDNGNVVGGTTPGTGNTIAFNYVGVAYGSGGVVLGNSIFSNSTVGIEIIGAASPALTSVAVTGAGIQVSGSLGGAQANSDYRIELFSNSELAADGTEQGRTFLGAITLHTVAAGATSFTADVNATPAGQDFVTATATTFAGDQTSQFARGVVSDAAFTVTSTTEAGNSLREAILAANAAPGTHTILFNIPANDPNHDYYRNDGVSGQVTLADVATTTATDDASIAGIDPDWPHSWYSIQLTSPLPAITNPIVIDGYSQPGSIANTNPVGQGLNSVLKIEISGENAGELSNGLIQITGGDSTVQGLVINRTQGAEIDLVTGNDLVEGNILGPDVSGTAAFPVNSSTGIQIGSLGNTIGGTTPAARNLISANYGYGIIYSATNQSGTNNQVKGNLIGTDRTGTRALGNQSGGILGEAGSFIVGGSEAGAGNLISGNGGTGVASENAMVQGNFIGTDVTGTLALGNVDGVEISGNVTLTQNLIEFNAYFGVDALAGGNFITNNTIAFNGTINTIVFNSAGVIATGGNLISQNAIFSNDGPDLALGGLNAPPPDSDGIQNYPVLSSVAASGPGTQVTGVLDSKPSSSFRLEFFADSDRNNTPPFDDEQPGEFGGGRTFLGTLDVVTDANGHASFTADLPALPSGQPFVTATATDVTDTGSGPLNNTSGFSPIAPLGGPSFVVTNTGDSGGVGTLREAITNANLTPGAHTITFAIPATDPRHFYYRNDGVAGQVSQADIAVTTATSDANIADIDPDWAHSWFSILPSSDLPQIENTVTIDGYSQPGSLENTLPALGPLNTVLKIELDGASAPGIGLNVGTGTASGDASYSRIDGLAINRFGGDGVELNTLDGNNIVDGDFIGTDVSGTVELGNQGDGVFVNFESGDSIGGATAGARNLISGNGDFGIRMFVPTDASVVGNVFGSDRIQAFALPNGVGGILITNIPETAGFAAQIIIQSAADTQFAADDTESGTQETNEIDTNSFSVGLNNGIMEGLGRIGLQREFQAADPLKPPSPTGVRPMVDYRSNQTMKLPVGKASNNLESSSVDLPEQMTAQIAMSQELPTSTPAYLGIDLGLDGVTPNDPGDLDDGPNGLQNFPVLKSATTIDGSTTIQGTLNSLALRQFRIDLYSSSYDTQVIRAGEVFLGSVEVSTDAAGNASFTFASPLAVPVGQFVISTATQLVEGSDGRQRPPPSSPTASRSGRRRRRPRWTPSGRRSPICCHRARRPRGRPWC